MAQPDREVLQSLNKDKSERMSKASHGRSAEESEAGCLPGPDQHKDPRMVVECLMVIPGVTSRMIEQIMDERTRTPFSDIDDFGQRIHGVGPVLKRQFKAYL